jgi:hypothetical protein
MPTLTTLALLATVPTTVALAIGLDLMAVVTWIRGRPRRLKRPGRP